MKRNEIRKKIKYAYSENSKIKFNNFKDSETNEISLKISENSKIFLNSFDYNLESPKGIIQKSKIFAKKVIRKSTRFILKPYAEKNFEYQKLNNEILNDLLDFSIYNDKNIKALNERMDNLISTKEEFSENKYVSFSQSGEDKIIEFLLNYGNSAKKGISYLDIGCNDYKNLSNTYLLYRKGINGVLIDANPIYINEININRPNDVILNCGVGQKSSSELTFYVLNSSDLSSFNLDTIKEAQKVSPWIEIVKEIKVPVYDLDTIYKKYFHSTPTIVSIDVEGDELGILSSSDLEKYRPYIFIIETIEYKDRVTLNNKRNDIVDFMNENDYIEYAFTGVNSIFLDKREFEGGIK
jgi:FkbM family methyltransferase